MFSLTHDPGPEPGGGSPECGYQTIVQESKQVNAEVLVVLHQLVPCRFRDIGGGRRCHFPAPGRQRPTGPGPGWRAERANGQPIEWLLTSGSELPAVPARGYGR